MTLTSHVPDTSVTEGRPPAVRPVYAAVTWKEIAYLLSSLLTTLVGFVYVVVMIGVAGGLAVTAIGLPLLAVGLFGARQLGRTERARARLLLGVRVAEPTPIPARGGFGGFFPWLWTSLKDPVGWRAVLYCLVRLPLGILGFTVVVAGLFVAWPVLPYVVRGLTNVDRAMVRGLLVPSDELERRIAELESDRGVVVDTAAADLRRIERDLHDGAQARLVALAMGLGLAKEKLLEDPDAAAAMVDEAHGEVKLALQELRDLARGIHPAVLTDRGLDAALSSVAARCTVPDGVTVSVELPGRPAEAVEGIAYFTVSELLQNVSKHAGARTAAVSVTYVSAPTGGRGPGARGGGSRGRGAWGGARLVLRVSDDGRGGARTGAGTGLAGLAERLDAVDGRFVVESPEGGGTVVTAELPWRERG